MTEQAPFTIESFYEFAKAKKLMGSKCSKCGKLLVPPRPMCPKCFSKDLEWKELQTEGKLLTYTVIHVAPKQFQDQTPYAVGIVEFEPGAQLPGIIAGLNPDKLKIGMDLTVDFDKNQQSDDWPQWPRHHFRPVT